MSIMDAINGFINGAGATQKTSQGTQPPQNSQTQTTPGNIPASNNTAAATANSGGTAPNGVLPATANQEQKPQSPLDEFASLWKNDDSQKPNTPQPLFNTNQEDFIKAAQKTDFKNTITPEQLKAIAGGGDEAMAAFAGAMNSVAQQVYAQSTYATTKLIEGAINKSNGTLKSEIPGIIKQHSMSDSLQTQNPALSHPAAQPIIEALRQQIAVKHPNATTKELTDMATNYLSGFAELTSPKQEDKSAQTKKGNQDSDWEKYFS